MMEDDERQKKLQAGKAKLAEYRQRKAQSDGQKKQKKKKKKAESDVEEQRRDDGDQTVGDQTTVFSLSKTLHSGETVTHDQTYTIEPESEVSTTAEDCSSEVNGFLERTGMTSVMADEESHVEADLQSGGPHSPTQIMQDELAAKTLAMEELSRELEEIRAAFGVEGVQQLQDFEEALKQRDEIITQLTANLQQARAEKEEVMREFLELTEQSQKLQIQFQQLQAGEILRSSNISSTTADLLQARQQISLYQQQLEEKDTKVKGHQEKTEEHLLLITHLQERLAEAERVRTQTEESFAQRLRDKDLLNVEQQRLISEHLQTLSQVQDQLLTSTQQLEEVNKHLVAKSQELENCERELSVSREKERMSSGEILQLMKTVEDLQQRCHQGSQSEGEIKQRMEEDWTRRMDQLRAELDEMYGEQIVQMKQELRVQHASDLDRIQERHSADTEKIFLQHHSELERFKGQLSHSTGDVGVLNTTVIELQQKLQESQELCDKAERELKWRSAENIDLVNQVERLHQELQSARVEVELRSKSPEKIQTEMQMLRDAITDLQAQLAAAQKATGDLEAKHESEVTNYKIKLDMLEREKDAVLDRMAESQEAELERLRTQLLFSHEEELVQLRNDLQRESLLNGENLRDEMAVRHREAVELLRMDFEDKARSVENERAVLAAERDALRHEVMALKNDLNQALENLKQKDKMKEENWEKERKDLECENKTLKETNTAMRDELTNLKANREILEEKTERLFLENQQARALLKDLQDEIEKQRNTFSFAEKNFEVNYQELKDEYTCLVNTKVQLEERLIKQMMHYETKLRDLHVELQTGTLRDKTEDEEVDGKTLVEKDSTELMEKLETSEREKTMLALRLSETVAQLTLMEADVKRLEEELKRDRDETVVRHKERQVQPIEDRSVSSGLCSVETHHMHISSLREETETLKSSLPSAEQERRVLTQEKSALVERLASYGGVNRDPSSHPAAQRSEGGERESTTADSLYVRTHAATHEDLLTDGKRRHPQQVKTEDPQDDGDSIRSECLMATQDMGDSDHDECRLQLEAQRISLSQIHAAQLELLRESLLAQLRSREQELQDAHERELRCLREEFMSVPQGVRGQSAELKVEFEDLEERHRQEIERLKIYYHEQMKDTEERTGAEEIFSTSSICPPLTSVKHEHPQDQESLSVDVEVELTSAGLSHELQALQKAQYESSCEGLERNVQEHQMSSHPEDTDLRHLQEKHHRELLEEEIAKVIVQMSVEFAQHTEHTRLSKRARETSTSTQTQNTETEQRLTDEQSDAVSMATAQSCTQSSDEEQTITQHRPEDDEDEHRDTPPELPDDDDDDDDEEEQQRGVVLAEDFSSELIQQEEEHTRVLESIRASHTHQMEFLQEHNTQLTAQIHTLNQQLLQQREQELLKERERQRDDQTYPSMQSSSTQTEQRREEEEEETKSDGRERPLTSHQPAQDSTSDIITTERDLLRKANSRLRLVLIDVLKTTAAAEETIGRHVEGILQSSCKGQLKATCPAEDPYSGPLRDAFSESFHGSETGADYVSMFSGEIDEGLEMSQRSQGVELQLHEAELQLEREEYLMSISTRLQSAVEKLLNTITETTTQLEHAHITKTELMREKFRHNEEMEELIHRQDELQERLRQEARGREQLALELHKAEGLIDGYTGERLALEQQVRERAELQRHLEQELRVTGNRLRELEQERCQMQQERELLSRQQDAMRDGAGSRELRLVDAALEAAPEADLLEETEKLMAEKVEVQLQAQKESSELLLQVKQLEAELEEQVSRVQELEEARRSEGADLRQQIQALEKQLENNRKFMDEQAADREHERDVFQQEIQTLEQQLKNPLKTQAANEHRDREVQELKSALQEKSDWCSELLLKSEQLQRDVQERNEEIETLGARLRELELMHRVEEVQHVSMAVRASDITLEAQLQTERDALDRKEKEILNLEEQLEQFREELQNKSEEVNQLHMQLEIQRKEISSNQQDLQAQSRLKQVLEEKDGQIAVLNTQITKLQHTGTEPKKEVVKEKDEVVRDLEAQVEHLKNEQEHLRRNKEEEVDQLNAVIEKLQQELSHIEHKQPVEEETSVEKDEYDEMKQKIDEVTKELDTLKSDHHSLLNKYEGLQQEVLTGRHTETVGKLEEALAENKDGVLCELKAQVDHLQSEQERLMRNKEEEVDQLNAVIKKLQQELSHTVHKQPQEEETSVEKAEHDEMKQKTGKVPKELDTLKSDHHSLQKKYEGQQQEVLTGRHTETGGELKDALGENKNEVLHKLEAQVEHLKSEQELLRRNKEEEVNQLNAVIKKLQQELSHFENKQPQEEGKSVEKAKYDEMKQKIDKVPKELDGLKSDHHSLRNKFGGQQQEVLTGRHAETGGELKDALGENKNEVFHKLEAQVEHLKSEQELLRRNKEEEVNHLNAVIKKLQQELSQIEHKQPQEEETSVEKAEHDKMKQKIDEVTRELDRLKLDHHSLLNKYKGLQQEVLTGRHTETVAVLEEALGEEKDKVLCKLEAQVEHLPSEQESLWKNKEEEVDQLKAVIKKLQQELSHIKHKQPQEEETSVEEAECDKMKQKIDEVTRELDRLKLDHHSLLNKYKGLQQEVLTGRHTETVAVLEEALGEEKEKVLCKLEAQVEHLPSEQEALWKNKEEEVDQFKAVIKKLQQELSQIKDKQPQEEETSVEKAEYDKMKQKIDEVTRELDTLKSDHHSLLNKYKGLQQEVLTGRHTETVAVLEEALGEERDKVLCKLEAHVEHLPSEQESLWKNKEEEVDQLKAVIKKLQQELSHIKHKQPQEEETSVEKAEYDKMKQKINEFTKELDTLKSDHHSLLNKYEGLQQEVLTGRHTETGGKLEETLGENKDEVLCKLEAQVEHLPREQESLRKNKEEEVDQLNAVIENLQQELSHIKHKQPQEGETVEKAEYDEMKQKINEVTKELDTLKSDHHSLLNKYEGLQQEMLSGRHTETVTELKESLGEEKDEVLRKMEAQVEHLQNEQEHLRRNKDEEINQLNAVIKKLQQELSHIEHKQPQGEETLVEKAEYDEMKQKTDMAPKELDTLKSDHHSLRNKFEGQQQEVLTGRHTETVAVLKESQGEEKDEVLRKLEAQVEHLQSEQESLRRNKEEEVNQLNAVIKKLQQELSHFDHKQPQEEGTSVEKAEHDKMKQKIDEVTRELDTLKSDHHSLLNKYEGLQQDMLTGRHTETVGKLEEALGENKDEVLHKLEAHVEHLKSEQESLKRNKEEEVDQLNAVIKKLQQELSSIQHKQPQEETSAEKAKYDEMKQKFDEVTKELDTLKSVHHSLLNKHEGQQQEVLTGRHTETVAELEEALREKTAAFVVVQAQVQALEESASSKIMDLSQRVKELEMCVEEKDSELRACRIKVEEAQIDADALLSKVTQLEEKLREKVAAVLVSQAQLGAVQTQSKELHDEAHPKDVTSELSGTTAQLKSKDSGVHLESEGSTVQQPKIPSVNLESKGSTLQLDSQSPTVQQQSKESGVHIESKGPTVQLDSQSPTVQQQSKESGVDIESKGPTVQLDSQSPNVQQQSKESGVHLESKGSTVQLDSQSPNVQQQSKESGVHLESKGSTVQLDSQSPTVQQQSKESVVHIESKGPTVQLDSQSPNVQQQSKESGVHLESEGPNIQPESEGARSQVVAPTLTPAGKLSILREKLKELEEGLSGMQKDQELQKYLLCSSEEEVQEYKKRLAVLMDLLNQMRTRPTQHRPESSDEVSDGSQSVSRELQEVEGEAASTKEELNCYRELSHKLQEEIEIKESTIAQLQTALNQVSAGVTREGDVAEAEKLLQELQEVKAQLVITQQELDTYREQSVRLQELVQEREMNVALLKDQLHKHASQEGDQSTSDLLQELQEVKDEAASAKEELNSYRERSLKLQEQIEVRDVSIAQLKEEVQELQAAVTRASDEPLSHPKKKHGDNRKHHGDDKTAPLSQENSTDQSKGSTPSASPSGTPGPSRVDVGTQADLPGADDVAEMIEGYTEKIGQMQELHAAEIMDMEARHISESESLKREKQRLEDRCRTLRDALEKLPTSEGLSVRSERPSVSPFKDEYTSDSSSDWSQRTGYDLIQQELRTTPDGARRDVEPDVLPDRIKTLLREVHQEGMEVLSLSEMERSGEQLHPQTWSLERDALINTIESLKVLISKLHTDTQVDGDWRAELLSAVQQVFVQERDVLRNFHHSHLDTTDAVVHLNQLERILTEQDVRHREFLGVLCSADRKSLITEIQQLRAQINTQHHTVVNSDITGNTERSQMLESEDLQTQLNQTKLQLENSLKSQNKLLKDVDTLRSEVSVKTAELESLNDRLADEQKRVRELQWLHEKDKCKADRKQEVEREEVEDLKLMLEEQRARVVELERERQISGQQTDGQQVCDVSVSAELQVQLEALRCRVVELSSALEKEKHLNTQLIQQLKTSVTPAAGSHDTLMQAEDTCSQVEAGVLSMESLLQTLQSQLAEKQTQTVQLMEQLERQKLNELQRRREFEEEKTSLSRSATQDQSTLRAAREGTARLERQTDELRAQLDAEREDRRMLERERDRLQERVRQLEEKLRVVENNQSTQTDAQSTDRTRDWVLQQKTGETQRETTDTPAGQSSDPNHVSNILGRLQLIAAKINSLTSDASGRLSVEASDRDSLAWLHNNVQDVMSLLQHIPSAPSALPESAGLQVGGSSSLLNERLLRQNAELTGFVSRLTEEKNELRNQILRLEEELHRLRQKNFSTLTVSLRSGAERHESLLFSNERESWTQEKSRLEKSLRQAESELRRLRGDIRSDTLRDLTGSDVDNSALRKLYGRYLRAESFRKALIYQKKYLLLLLGGFQECEEATLSLIARMGGRPTHTGLESLGRPRRGFTRFRSAVRVCIALSRMKFLVKRWQRSAGVAFSSQIISRNGQITGTDVRNESSYLQPGGVDVFRERRTPSRGRTGQESPRSAASVQHRYHIIAGDSGGLPCSHLQNYDPDRALTDYISRLEALQRRLGSVQSGSSSYAQMHFGVRR